MMTIPIRFGPRCITTPRNAVFGLFMILCLVVFGPNVSAQEHHYIIFDAPFADLNPGDYNGTFPTGINESGAVTGYTNDANYVSHAFLRSPNGKIITFQAPGADTNPADAQGTAPSAINELGAIVGNYGDSTGYSHGFLRTPDGKFTIIDVPGAGGYGTYTAAINLEGVVVGLYTDSNFSFRGFVRTPDGKYTTFIGPGACTTNSSEGCYGSGASNVNIWGTFVGGFEDNDGNFVHHGLIRTLQTKLTVFDAPNAGTGSYEGTGCPGCHLGLNDWGTAAGNYIDTNSVQHGFLRSPDGKFTTFDAPGAGNGVSQGTGCPSDCPTSINNLGAVTGTYIDANYTFHGYLRKPTGQIATIDPPGTLYTEPYGINDCGSITGIYLDANGVYHGFITTTQ